MTINGTYGRKYFWYIVFEAWAWWNNLFGKDVYIRGWTIKDFTVTEIDCILFRFAETLRTQLIK